MVKTESIFGHKNYPFFYKDNKYFVIMLISILMGIVIGSILGILFEDKLTILSILPVFLGFCVMLLGFGLESSDSCDYMEGLRDDWGNSFIIMALGIGLINISIGFIIIKSLF